MSVVQIVPVEIPQSPIVQTSIRIIVTRVELGVSANIDAHILNADGAVVEVKHLVLSQPDYANWGLDDQFIVDWTLQQLGLSPSTNNQ